MSWSPSRIHKFWTTIVGKHNTWIMSKTDRTSIFKVHVGPWARNIWSVLIVFVLPSKLRIQFWTRSIYELVNQFFGLSEVVLVKQRSLWCQISVTCFSKFGNRETRQRFLEFISGYDTLLEVLIFFRFDFQGALPLGWGIRGGGVTPDPLGYGSTSPAKAPHGLFSFTQWSSISHPPRTYANSTADVVGSTLGSGEFEPSFALVTWKWTTRRAFGHIPRNPWLGGGLCLWSSRI